ncbi:dipeptide/oligopeptide/nickel ABC transporter ATP-binding protein [Lactococcus hodotermopsidis]|uniref:Dipeptide/oligopeptide/nickel ABC transporter ATP-binding protein n=1 Tax=Pseudolactococcus hodotermopsidis TaxID=2709157 RepID=A0A6A0BBU0_9LACT|nr:ATP-binding cassette domain-containing protein [Lactococcus hodotermopsidis]GFH42125.1 dipeptide/oligopeptide/nickel ABC transporter ATP-binding protein [Lactococcus hodotermopsidis]
MLKKFKVSTFLFLMILLLSFFMMKFSPYAPNSIAFEMSMLPNQAHLLGTNAMGQDVLTRLAHATFTSLLFGLIVSMISTALSAILGLLAGFHQLSDKFINGLANILMVFPNLLIILIVAAFTGGGFLELILMMSFLTWPAYMRLIRAEVLQLKEMAYVISAKNFGGSMWHILRQHILPNISSLVKSKFIIQFRGAIIAETGLAFLGIGDPNVITLGNIINEGFVNKLIFLNNSWLWLVLPAIVILLLTTICLTFANEPQNNLKITSNKKKLKKSQNPKNYFGNANLCVTDLTLQFDDKLILEQVSFEMKAGEIVSIVGASGVGKTSFVKAIYGLLPPENMSGNVQIAEIDMTTAAKKEVIGKTCTYIYQDANAAFNPVLTIGEQFYEYQSNRQKVAEALENVGLNETILQSYPHENSGGMLSRAMIALAIINEPDFIIADECTSALDPILKKEIVDLLVSKIKNRQIGLLFITHELEIAHSISDRILRIENQKFIEEVAVI